MLASLRVSCRTLQDYRNEGRIAYIQLGGKILYRESDIERMLNDGYRSAYRQSITWFFLKECSLSSALWLRSNGLSTKRKRNGLRMKHQYPVSSVSRSFLFFCFFRQSLVYVARCLSSVWQVVARFSDWIRSNLFEEDSARNGIAAWPCLCRQSHTLPLHPTSVTSGWWNGLNSTIP